MNDEPLGDFELMGESRARRAFRPSNEGCLGEPVLCGSPAGGWA